ncbi:MAG: hypothetical protein CMO01_17440 [Thalassobius sp.]|nr:hypothetical protein [Thalassovita sp.]
MSNSLKMLNLKNTLIPKIFVLLLVSTGIGYPIYQEIYLYYNKGDQRFTIATITGYYIKARETEGVEYEYMVNGKRYEGMFKDDIEKYDIGQRFLVEYWKGRPKWSNIQESYPLPMNYSKPPIEGWKLDELNKIDKRFKAE